MEIEQVIEGRDPSEVQAYVLRDWDAVDELIQFRDGLRERSPGTQALFILDDADQASYTSGHATNLYLPSDLDRTEYSTLMIAWLNRELADASLELDYKLIPIDDPDINLIGRLDDSDLVFRQPLHCFVVESAEPSLAIAAQPNGYFTGDLTAAQNYLLAEQLRRDFELEIFGLGSDSVAYCRKTPLELAEAHAVVDSVKDMYSGMTEELAAQWAARTVGRRWFLLSYRGA